ncbi:hypothetical protein [Sphingobacterium sp. JUb56]|uniref:hypothetical protein n=1 Tax=Sphingobacterium sp. JUb56 TaxID=2587145 RepID=UPI001616E3B3|nr:hypothetical protein [Sphingobacterium sp. JUb56]MBB2951165.1 hypothetical protein [Sphingobacterium sp. JUb56]
MMSLNIFKPFFNTSLVSLLILWGCNSENKQKQSIIKSQQNSALKGIFLRSSDTSTLVSVIDGEKRFLLYKMNLKDSIDISKFFGERVNDSLYIDWRDYKKFPYNPKSITLGGSFYPSWSIARKIKENPKIDIKRYISVEDLLKDTIVGHDLQQISAEEFSALLSNKLSKKTFDFEKNQILFDTKNLKGHKYNCNIGINYKDLKFTFDSPSGTINLYYDLTISTSGEVIKSNIAHLKNTDQNPDLINEVANHLIGTKTQVYTILDIAVATCIPCSVKIKFN